MINPEAFEQKYMADWDTGKMRVVVCEKHKEQNAPGLTIRGKAQTSYACFFCVKERRER